MEIKYEVMYHDKRVKAIGTSCLGTEYRAYAKCMPGDNFTVSDGKKICRLKIEQKQLKKIEENTREKIKELEQHLATLKNKINRINRARAKINNMIYPYQFSNKYLEESKNENT
jgi:septal ring factor EnvC (AmiA/AmiB activator)